MKATLGKYSCMKWSGTLSDFFFQFFRGQCAGLCQARERTYYFEGLRLDWKWLFRQWVFSNKRPIMDIFQTRHFNPFFFHIQLWFDSQAQWSMCVHLIWLNTSWLSSNNFLIFSWQPWSKICQALKPFALNFCSKASMELEWNIVLFWTWYMRVNIMHFVTGQMCLICQNKHDWITFELSKHESMIFHIKQICHSPGKIQQGLSKSSPSNHLWILIKIPQIFRDSFANGIFQQNMANYVLSDKQHSNHMQFSLPCN